MGNLSLDVDTDFKSSPPAAMAVVSPYFVTRAPMPLWLVPICFVATIGSLMLPPHPYRKFIALPVLLGAMVALPRYTTGHVVADFESMMFVWMVSFRYFDLLWWSRPEEDFRRVPKKWKEDDGRVEEEGKPEDLMGKARWSASLFWNHRGIGWNWRISSIPQSEMTGLSKIPFLKEAFFRQMFALLLTIFVASVMLSTDYYKSAEKYADIYQDTYFRRTIVNYATTLVLDTGMQVTYWTTAFISVLCNFTSPEDWPDVIGNPAETYTVRRLWGVTHHQLFRRVMVTAANKLSTALAIPPKSLASRVMHLVTAFVISAALHHAGGIMISGGTMGNYAFFLSQAAAIVLEDVVVMLFAFLGYKLTATTKALGFAWVAAWLSFSLTPFVAGYISSGYGRGVALNSNCGVDGFLSPFVVLKSAGSTNAELLLAMAQRGLIWAAAVAVLVVIRRIMIPGKRLVDRSVVGF